MALGSQAGKVDAIGSLTGLVHDIFVGDVADNVRCESPTSMMFRNAGPGDFRLEGQNMVGAVDLRFKTGGMASDGNLPDASGLDAVQFKITPVRRYARIAIDNFVEARSTGPAAFEDFGTRVFKKLWAAWKYMEVRHAVGAASGLIGKCSSRTSSTVFVIKDAYGNASSNPLTQLAEGSTICWYDVDQTQIGGAAKVTSTGLAYDTLTVTVDSATNWETAVGNQLAANDLIYFSTTDDTTADYFTAERNLAPNGVGQILDPTASLSTVFNIAEADYERWKPFRKSSVTFDHLEVTEHWQQLAQKRMIPVTPATDEAVTFPSCVSQLARSLMAFQQQAYTGGDLQGGYRRITISGMSITEDGYFYHNVFATLHKPAIFRAVLGGDADFWAGDGSMWQRISDYDGKEAYVAEYMNYISNHRGAHGALTGITTDVTDADFDPTPNY